MSSLSLLETDIINVMIMDVIPVIVNIVVKVLLINLMTKRCRCKKNQGKEGGKLPPPATKNNGKCN